MNLHNLSIGKLPQPVPKYAPASEFILPMGVGPYWKAYALERQ